MAHLLFQQNVDGLCGASRVIYFVTYQLTVLFICVLSNKIVRKVQHKKCRLWPIKLTPQLRICVLYRYHSLVWISSKNHWSMLDHVNLDCVVSAPSSLFVPPHQYTSKLTGCSLVVYFRDKSYGIQLFFWGNKSFGKLFLLFLSLQKAWLLRLSKSALFERIHKVESKGLEIEISKLLSALNGHKDWQCFPLFYENLRGWFEVSCHLIAALWKSIWPSSSVNLHQ